MFSERYAVLILLTLVIFILGCGVHSKYTTRSFMSEEEIEELEESYTTRDEEEEVEELVIEPFLERAHGPLLKVNEREINAKDIRDLYDYLTSYLGNDAAMSGIRQKYSNFDFLEDDISIIKRMVCDEWIKTYAAMTQYPDTIDATVERLDKIREQTRAGAEFINLIVENSQEPMAEQSGGFLGAIEQGKYAPIFEMHAYAGSVGEIQGPFPTIFGWHLIDVIKQDDESDEAIPQARHLILFHGFNTEHGDLARNPSRIAHWVSTATIELLTDDLDEILPEYVAMEISEPEEMNPN